MDKSQDKLDKSLQSIIENSFDNNEKIPIVILLNENVNKSKIQEILKNIPTLDIEIILEELCIISASINISYINLLKEISEIKWIEYNTKVQI